MNRLKRLREACVPALASFLLLLACACADQNQSNVNQAIERERVAGTRGGSFTYRLTEPPQSFNPVVAARESDFFVSYYLTGGKLLNFDHDERRWAPGLAESWQASDDGRSVEITLREGLKFSDGQPITSSDVEFSMRAYYGTPQSTIGSSLKIGGKEIEVRVKDERRLEFVFPEAVAVHQSYLVNVVVLPRHALEKDFSVASTPASAASGSNQSAGAGEAKRSIAEAYGVTADPKSIVTSGAFAFEQVQPGERIVLRRNPHFWKRDSAGTELPYLDQLTIEIVPDADAAVTRLREGNLDVVDRIRPTDYAALRNDGGAVRAVDLGPGLATDHIVFNLNEGGASRANALKQSWFKDERFRRAVSHAIDRESFATGTLRGLATPIYNFVPPSNREWAAGEAPRADFNLERARSLLSEAGFTFRGPADAPELFDAQNNRVEFTLLVQQENSARNLMATAIQNDLAKIGVKVNPASVSGADFADRMRKSFDYDAALFGLNVTDFDPSSYAVMLKSDGAQHQWRLQPGTATDWEKRLDELTAQLSTERNPETRRAVFREIQIIMAERLPLVPLFARHITSAANQRIGNYRPSPVVPYSLWNAEELFIKN